MNGYRLIFFFPFLSRLATVAVLFVGFGFSDNSVSASDPSNVNKSTKYILRYDQLHHPVKASKGMVVSQNNLSSDIGARILEQGGNAIDAAIAVGFSLAVTLPRAGNLGGGGFMMVYVASENRTFAIDYRGAAPALANAELFLTREREVNRALTKRSYTASTVPGTVAGLYEAHRRWGKLPWSKLLAPAIELARDGIIVSRDLAWALTAKRDVLFANGASRRKFFAPSGEPLQRGDRWRQPDLAQSLSIIATSGRDGFYQGILATKISEDMKNNNGLITASDLTAYRARVVEPLTRRYRGYQVATMPPPAGGVHLLQMLAMMEKFDLSALGSNSADTTAVLAESMKRAYAYRAELLGDPEFVEVPVEQMLDDAVLVQQGASIDLSRATRLSDIAPRLGADIDEGPDTTHFSVMDSDGNAVANTYTLSASFGSGVTIQGTGILMNNQINNFALLHGIEGASVSASSFANSLKPGKRPKSTQTPLIVFRDEHPFLVSGTPGGRRIITTMVQLISNVLDHGMNIAQATHSPRMFHGWRNDELELEPGFSRDTVTALENKGYNVKAGASMGSTQSIVWDGRLFYGSADPRRPGAKASGIEALRN